MRYMEKRNNVTEFILLGLTQNLKVQKIIFALFLIVYIVSMVGNVLTLVTITTSSLLGSPMYFFLAHLSFIDACYSCVNTPKLIIDSLYEKKISPFNGCTQAGWMYSETRPMYMLQETHFGLKDTCRLKEDGKRYSMKMGIKRKQ